MTSPAPKARASSRHAQTDPEPSGSGAARAERPLAATAERPAPTLRARAARRITARDEEILAWLSRQRFATAEQVAARFGIGRNRCARRLGELAAAGLLGRSQPFLAPSVYLVTLSGLAVARAQLPAPKVDVRTFRHDRGLAGLVVAYELEGATTITERELRAAAAAGSDRYVITFADGSAGSPRRHFPDLIVRSSAGELTAVELELTPKRTRRLRSILRAYRRASHVGRVLYLSDRAALLAQVEQLGRELRLEHKLFTRPWEQE